MKNLLFTFVIAICLLTKAYSQTEKEAAISNPNFDKQLAENLEADDFGMKSYFFVILKTGSNETKDSDLISSSFRGHLENINRLAEEGKLILAGPFSNNEKQYRGIFILSKIDSMEEAKELLLTDPAIKNQLLDYEIFSWYGSAALSEYLPFAEKIWKVKP